MNGLKDYQIVAAVAEPVYEVKDRFEDPVVATHYEAHALSTVDGRSVSCAGESAWALGLAGRNVAESCGEWGGALTTHPGSKAVAKGRHGLAVAVGGISTAEAGVDGAIILGKLDIHGRMRYKVGYVGEGGIEVGVAYRLDDDFEFEVVLEGDEDA